MTTESKLHADLERLADDARYCLFGLGSAFAHVRYANRISLRKLAAELDIHHAHLHMLEKGQMLLSVEKMQRVIDWIDAHTVPQDVSSSHDSPPDRTTATGR